jgi:flagellar protein FlaG
MASASVAELIIFIAAVSIAATVSGAMVTTVGGISDSLDERGADVASDIATDVEIISDPGSGAVYNASGNEVRVLVKNIGEKSIGTGGSAVEVLIDGRYISPSEYTITVLDGSTWQDGDVVRIVVNKSLTSGDHSVTVVVESERETLQFRT